MVERHLVAFDVVEGPIGPAEVGSSLDGLRQVPGVQSVALYETRDGRVPYLLDVQVESAEGERIHLLLRRMLSDNGEHLSNVVQRRYTKLA